MSPLRGCLLILVTNQVLASLATRLGPSGADSSCITLSAGRVREGAFRANFPLAFYITPHDCGPSPDRANFTDDEA